MNEQERSHNHGARTSDWIGQIKDQLLYAYDLGSIQGGSVQSAPTNVLEVRPPESVPAPKK